MENADIANDLLLILKMSDVACQLNFNIKKKKLSLVKVQFNYLSSNRFNSVI